MNSKAIRVALVAVLVVCSVFVAATLPASASATADNFGVEDASGFKNTNVLVPVNITNVHSELIVGIEFEFLYDGSVINLAEIHKGALISQWSDPDKKGTEGDYVIAIVGSLSTAIINGSTGSVVVLNFSVIGESSETSPMNLTNIKLVNKTFDETGTAPPKNGTFKVPDITNVTTPEIPEEPSPIPSGHVLNWTNKAVMLSVRRIDPGSSGINYTNLSASPPVNVRISNNSLIWDVTLTEDNYTVLKNETFSDTFNVTISDECNTTIYYYSVDKNGTANVEVTKNLTVRIDRTKPTIVSVNLSTIGTTSGLPITVTVNATDNVGVTNITVEEIALTSQGSGDIWIGEIIAEVGTNVIVNVIAMDAAGNAAYNNTTTYNATAPIPPPTPTPAPAGGGGGGGGGGAPTDTDGDGISDIDEMLAGTDWKDPCDPNTECAACLVIRPPTPIPIPLVTPTQSPSLTPTPTPTPPASVSVIRWFIITAAIVAAAISVSAAYLVLRRKKERK